MHIVSATDLIHRLIEHEVPEYGLVHLLDLPEQHLEIIELLLPELRRVLMKSQQLITSHRVDVHSVTGQSISGDYMFVRRLEIGGVELKDLAVIFANAHTFKKLGMQDKPAILLGMNAMRAFKKVSIDFANRKFRVVLPDHSSAETLIASLPQSVQPMPAAVGRTGLRY